MAVACSIQAGTSSLASASSSGPSASLCITAPLLTFTDREFCERLKLIINPKFPIVCPECDRLCQITIQLFFAAFVSILKSVAFFSCLGAFPRRALLRLDRLERPGETGDSRLSFFLFFLSLARHQCKFRARTSLCFALSSKS